MIISIYFPDSVGISNDQAKRIILECLLYTRPSGINSADEKTMKLLQDHALSILFKEVLSRGDSIDPTNKLLYFLQEKMQDRRDNQKEEEKHG